MADPLRVLVTRTRPGRLGALLSEAGCTVVSLPLFELFPTGRPAPLHAPPPDGVVVTSAAVVRLAPGAVRWMRTSRVVAVGPATARALASAGVEVASVAKGTGADALACFPHGAQPCFVGALRPAPTLAEAIRTGRVVHWAVYDRRALVPDSIPAADVVALASPSAARGWADLDGRPDLPCVAIGPTTRDAACSRGLPVAATAAEPSMKGLAEAVLSGRWRG